MDFYTLVYTKAIQHIFPIVVYFLLSCVDISSIEEGENDEQFLPEKLEMEELSRRKKGKLENMWDVPSNNIRAY